MAIGATHKKMVKKRRERERERLWIVGRSRFTKQKSWWRFCVLSMMEHHLKIMRISKIWNVFFCSDFSETKQRVVGSELRICISQFKKPWSEIFKGELFIFFEENSREVRPKSTTTKEKVGIFIGETDSNAHRLPEKVMELNALPESLTESLSEKPSFRYPAQNKAPAEKICVWLQRFNFQIRFASESR